MWLRFLCLSPLRWVCSDELMMKIFSKIVTFNIKTEIIFLQFRMSWIDVKFFPAILFRAIDVVFVMSCDVVMLLWPPMLLSLESSFTDSDSLRSSVVINSLVTKDNLNVWVVLTFHFMSISHFRYSLNGKMKDLNNVQLNKVCWQFALTADDVIDDFENKRSASLNLRLRLSALDIILLFDVKYLSHPRIIFP